MREKVSIESVHFRPIELHDFEDLQRFSSGNSSMDDFLKREAYYRHISREASTTLIFVEKEIVGYLTLQRKSIDLEKNGEDNRDCLDIARLAISESKQGLGIGQVSLHFVKGLAYMINERYITLDALYEKREWYQTLGFKVAIEEEYENENEDSLVYMYLDVYDPKLIDDYFNENP